MSPFKFSKFSDIDFLVQITNFAKMCHSQKINIEEQIPDILIAIVSHFSLVANCDFEHAFDKVTDTIHDALLDAK